MKERHRGAKARGEERAGASERGFLIVFFLSEGQKLIHKSERERERERREKERGREN